MACPVGLDLGAAERRDDVEVVLGGIDVLVLTSRFEGVPGVLVEAAMAACPAVTYPVGDVAEVQAPGGVKHWEIIAVRYV